MRHWRYAGHAIRHGGLAATLMRARNQAMVDEYAVFHRQNQRSKKDLKCRKGGQQLIEYDAWIERFFKQVIVPKFGKTYSTWHDVAHDRAAWKNFESEFVTFVHESLR